MKVVLQRVKSAYVKVDSNVISEIDNGYLLLWGIEESDSFKRCAMKLGLGLHLWAGEEYYLDKQLDKKEIGKKTKLQSA